MACLLNQIFQNLLLIFLLIIQPSCSETKNNIATFTRSEKFNRLTIHNKTGTIYIGAVNKIYQLNANLVMENSVTTGPSDDNPHCPLNPKCEEMKLKPMDNFNKILLIDYHHERLITCGTLHQGMCFLYDIHDMSGSEHRVYEMVAANNSTASTIAFIAPGPPDSSKNQTLYVGVTFTNNGPYRYLVPAIASRSLDKETMLTLAKQSATTRTSLHISSINLSRYPVNYIYGFHSGGYSYFLTTQPQNLEANGSYVSKIIRICQNDSDYHSYAEIIVECNKRERSLMEYNLVKAAHVGKPGNQLALELGISMKDDVLFAVFSKNKFNRAEGAYSQSGLCVYSLKDINRMFQLNIKNCFEGTGELGLDFVTPSTQCIKTHLVVTEDFCGADVNTPFEGKLPVVTEAVVTFPKSPITAAATTVINDEAIVFLGTSTGHLLKVAVHSSTKASQFTDIEVESTSPINSDLLIDPDNKFIYAMTERTLSRLPISNCDIYSNCKDCLAAKNPFCGWCSSENKCAEKSNCQHSKDPLYWLNYRTGMCITIKDVQPKEIQWKKAGKLELTVENMLTDIGQIKCAYVILDKTVYVNATRTAVGLSCPVPKEDFPQTSSDEYNVVAKLSIREIDGPDIAFTKITIYDCKRLLSCSICISISSCNWCANENVCIPTSEHCKDKNVEQKNGSLCPGITSENPEILMPAEEAQVTVKAMNFNEATKKSELSCQFNVEGQVIRLPAKFVDDTIRCEKNLFTYTGQSASLEVSFNVLWGEKLLPLDNPQNIHLKIYKCNLMAENCGLCLVASEKYKCGWCKSSNTCSLKSQCTSGDSVWYDRQQTCPNPQILDFNPKTGPVDGGTRITIKGINLGKTIADFSDDVAVAGYKCTPIQDDFIPTVQFVCEIDVPDVPPTSSYGGPIKLSINKQHQATSEASFTYLSPEIKKIHPRKGPKSGGTKIRITGDNLETGDNIAAFVDNIPCKIIVMSKNQVECLTSPSEQEHIGDFWMTFENAQRTSRDLKFQYIEDPIVTSVQSGPRRQNPDLRGIPGGGIIIRVEGKNFDGVSKPQIYVTYKSENYNGTCIAEKSEYLECRSPVIPVDEDIDTENPLILKSGFIMDNVMFENYEFKLYPNPTFEKFDGADHMKEFKSDYLTIEGTNIDLACDEKDIQIKIGKSNCALTSTSITQLTCRPNLDIEDEKQISDVIVIVGGNQQHNIGFLEY